MAYYIVYPCISHRHACRPHIALKEAHHKSPLELSQLTLKGAVVIKLQVLSSLPQMYSHRIKDGYKRLRQLQSFCLHSITSMPSFIVDLL